MPNLVVHDCHITGFLSTTTIHPPLPTTRTSPSTTADNDNQHPLSTPPHELQPLPTIAPNCPCRQPAIKTPPLPLLMIISAHVREALVSNHVPPPLFLHWASTLQCPTDSVRNPVIPPEWYWNLPEWHQNLQEWPDSGGMALEWHNSSGTAPEFVIRDSHSPKLTNQLCLI